MGEREQMGERPKGKHVRVEEDDFGERREAEHMQLGENGSQIRSAWQNMTIKDGKGGREEGGREGARSARPVLLTARAPRESERRAIGLTEQMETVFLVCALEDLYSYDEIPYVPELSDRGRVDGLWGDEADELERDRRARLGMQSSQRMRKDKSTGTRGKSEYQDR